MAALAGESCGTTPHAPRAVAPAKTSPSASTSASASTPPPAIDSDGDGVLDPDDACPTIAGVPSPEAGKHGCPKVVVQVCLSIIILERPHFAPGSAKLSPEATPILDATADTMKAHPEIEEVEVAGHCDAVEKPCPDDARARVVRDALVSRGVEATRLKATGKGRDEPVASNGTAEERAKNRRVDFKVTKRKD